MNVLPSWEPQPRARPEFEAHALPVELGMRASKLGPASARVQKDGRPSAKALAPRGGTSTARYDSSTRLPKRLDPPVVPLGRHAAHGLSAANRGRLVEAGELVKRRILPPRRIADEPNLGMESQRGDGSRVQKAPPRPREALVAIGQPAAPRRGLTRGGAACGIGLARYA